MGNRIRRVAVYCGSANGVARAYARAAREMGRLLAERGIGLVYGGGGTGLMGELARATLAAGGEVIGVMPHFMVEREVELAELADLRRVTTMHERKAMMADLADAFVGLPGGLGTLEELFEAWTHTTLGLADKPCGLLNTNSFYDDLLKFIRHAAGEKFIRARALRHLIVERNPVALLDGLHPDSSSYSQS